jgi:hypothetical protein
MKATLDRIMSGWEALMHPSISFRETEKKAASYKKPYIMLLDQDSYHSCGVGETATRLIAD